jgi:exopolyphosphatase/guanosine-5'-triphosphate,3'-diphosphate pyrophosphatase
MGSTSFNLLVADVTEGGRIEPVERRRTMLRLGTAIAEHGRIPKELRLRTVAVARELGEIVRERCVPHFYPVATAGLRDAANGARVARMIADAVEEPVRILSGREEARAIFLALRARLDLGNEAVLGLDLGGGSLEVAVGRGDVIDEEATLGLGVVRLVGEFVRSDPIERGEMKAIRKRVRKRVRPYRKRLMRSSPLQAVATGGTARALARLVDPEQSRTGGDENASVVVGLDELEDLTERLLWSDHDERIAMPGMRLRRADLLPTGALIYVTICQELGFDDLTLCDWGLREGILLSRLGR